LEWNSFFQLALPVGALPRRELKREQLPALEALPELPSFFEPLSRDQ